MKSFLKIIGLLLILSFVISSCRKKCRTDCSESDLSVFARGFTASELDTVEVLEFVNNGQFNHLRNTSFKFIQEIGEQEQLGTHLGWFSKHSDWIIKIPSAGRSFRISAITDEGKRFIEEDCRIKDSFCQNEISTFEIDGVQRIRVPAFLDK